MSSKPKSKPSAPVPEIAESMKAAAVLWGVPLPALRAAKESGCQAFRGARVFRTPLFEWLQLNQDVAGEAVAVDVAKASKAELEVEKLRAQTTFCITKNLMLNRTIILRDEAKAEWARALGILESEYQQLMDPELFAIAQRRAQLRIRSVLDDDGPAQQNQSTDVYSC